MQNTSYTVTAKALHWGVAVLIFGLLGLGFYMADLPISPTKLKLYSWHKWAGVSVFALVVVRLAWRATHRPPALPQHMSWMARYAAHAGHAALYALMLAIPLSGWLMSSAQGFQTVWFGVLPLPDLVGRNEALGDVFNAAHVYLNFALIALVAAHIGAAFKHHFKYRDDVLVRMLPHRKPGKNTQRVSQDPTTHA